MYKLGPINLIIQMIWYKLEAYKKRKNQKKKKGNKQR